VCIAISVCWNVEVSRDTGQAVDRGRRLNKTKPFEKLRTEVCSAKQAANLKFRFELFMMWFVNF
jgi:hypothetical protein